MAERLRVRVYNVRFGDAVLVTVPDRDGNQITTRHVLIDVGNVLSKEGGDDAVFRPVVENILEELNGRPLDLYVMTHEHLDHVQGLFHASTALYPPGELKQKLDVQYAWLTASAAPDYYRTHSEAEKRKRLYSETYSRLASHLKSLKLDTSAPVGVMLANNNPRSTAQCVDFLRELAPKQSTFYVHRETDTKGKHPFKEAHFEIWAPEEDTSEYYRRSLLPMMLGGAETAAGPPLVTEPPEPPSGVDAGAFFDLLAIRESGIADNLLAIDKATNNTSIVFALIWRNRKLLFAGDAELSSWRTMDKEGVLEPVDFLKVSHHGSHNGTPQESVLEKFLPKSTRAKTAAAISTWDETYPGIPHTPTNKKLRARAKLSSTLDAKTKLYRDFYFKD